MKIFKKFPFLRALRFTLFSYIPHWIEARSNEYGGFGLHPWDYFFWYWGHLMNEKHNDRIRFIKKRG